MRATRVGDNPCVLRVGLAVPAIGRRSVVHDPPGNVERLLSVRFEQGNQQRRPTGVQVGRPHHGITVGRDEHRRDQVQEGTFVVVDPLGQDHGTSCVDRDAVMGTFTGIDAYP